MESGGLGWRMYSDTESDLDRGEAVNTHTQKRPPTAELGHSQVKQEDTPVLLLDTRKSSRQHHYRMLAGI